MQSEIGSEPDEPYTTGQDAPTGNTLRVAKTNARIIAAVITCMDEVGYLETSINRVQRVAGVSRGALTHHYPSKEAMMVGTLKSLLDPVRGNTLKSGGSLDALSRAAGQGDGIASDMRRLWAKVLNTQAGRALVEILVAARSDTALQTRIQPCLAAYNDQINTNFQNLYRSSTGEDDDIRVLLDRFASIMEPHMTARARRESD